MLDLLHSSRKYCVCTCAVFPSTTSLTSSFSQFCEFPSPTFIDPLTFQPAASASGFQCERVYFLVRLPTDVTLQLGIFQGCMEVLQNIRNCPLFARSSTPLFHLHVPRATNLAAVCHTDHNQVSDNLQPLQFNKLMFALRAIV